MDSWHKPGRPALLTLAAVALSAFAYYWAYGLQPVWWLMMLAPLPLLVMAPRLPAWAAATMTFASMTIGGLDMWQYHHELRFPLWLMLACLLEPSIILAFAVLVYRVFFLRNQLIRAVLAFPTLLVAGEHLVSLSQGTFGNTAYTQLRDLPLLQLGSLTGLWGIGFITLLLPTMGAGVILLRRGARIRMGVALVAVTAAVLIYGEVRLHTTPPAPASMLVGLVESDTPPHIFPDTDPAVLSLMNGYAQQIKALAARGAQFVVLPEMTARIRDSLSPTIDTLFQQTARAAGVQVLVGVLHVTDHGTYNEGRLYSAAGAIETVYSKHHLVPVVEGRTTPGTEISVLPEPEGTIGIEICRDMDYPELARRYAARGVGLVLVPAWEFGGDEVWHGHMALMRAVEDGFTLARTAKQGLLTVSDDRGRIIAESSTSPLREFTTLLATVPVRHDPTLYERWGDWFAWLDLALSAALLLSFLQKKNKAAIREPRLH